MTRRFTVWNGVAINPAYQHVRDIRDALLALRPPHMQRFSLEWLVKAGEGGSYQARGLHQSWGDPHPLAIDGPATLRRLYLAGQRLRPRLYVTPYVVVRGRPDWNQAEWTQIAACAAVAKRVVLNLEDGPAYWGGPTDPESLRAEYLWPLAYAIREAETVGRRRVSVELCAIPRLGVLEHLGGVPAILTWLEFCAQFRGSASWECYDAASPHRDGERYECLDVAHSFERLEGAGVWGDAQWRIPVVQRSRIGAWASTKHARRGLQVWHLGGD